MKQKIINLLEVLKFNEFTNNNFTILQTILQTKIITHSYLHLIKFILNLKPETNLVIVWERCYLMSEQYVKSANMTL